MNLGCAIGGHVARRRPTYNSGYYFSACGRCRRQMIRTASGDWQTVPVGHRVVWKAGRHSHSLEADYSGVLPIVGEETAALPAPRSPFVSWSRALVRMRLPDPSPGKTAAAAAAAQEESGDYQYPRLLLMAVILGAGLKMLLSLATGR